MTSSQLRTERQLDVLLAQPGNNQCADCHAPAPRWASINLGIFLCVQCASIHRSLGTHTSRVKSLTMDTWTREMVEHMRVWGNARANAVWNPDEGRWPVPLGGGEEGRQGEMERYVRNKYERGLFRGDRRTEEKTFKNDAADARQVESNGAPRRPSMEDTTTSDRRPPDQYAYEAPNTTRKKLAARAHVDSNWADFIGGTTPSYDSTDRPTSSGSRKAGRLLGMEEDRGAVRLPPVTRAPRGLVYKREGEEGPPPVVPRKMKTPEREPAQVVVPTVTPDLVNFNDSVHVPAPYHVASVPREPTPQMQTFYQEQQPQQAMTSTVQGGYNAYNPFLNPQQLGNGTGYPMSMQPSANGTGYPNTMQPPPPHTPTYPQYTPTSAFPFQQQQQGHQAFFSPGLASAGGYFANGQAQAGTGNPFFTQQPQQQQQQQQQQGTGYGGWSR